MKLGRPTKKVDARLEILLDALRDGMPIKRACDFAMISDDVFYKWVREDEVFAMNVKYARSYKIRGLLKEVTKKDPWKLLKSLDSEHFKDETHQEIKWLMMKREIIGEIDDKELLTTIEQEMSKLKQIKGEVIVQDETREDG